MSFQEKADGLWQLKHKSLTSVPFEARLSSASPVIKRLEQSYRPTEGGYGWRLP